MDNPAPGSTIRSTWAPSGSLVGVGWLLTVVAGTAAGFTALSGDRPGTLLLGIAALALLALTAHGTFVRPRLAADRQGVRIRRLNGTHRLDWPDVRIRLATTRRWGRDVAVLELESAELVVLGRIELGADPSDVHDELLALRPF